MILSVPPQRGYFQRVVAGIHLFQCQPSDVWLVPVRRNHHCQFLHITLGGDMLVLFVINSADGSFREEQYAHRFFLAKRERPQPGAFYSCHCEGGITSEATLSLSSDCFIRRPRIATPLIFALLNTARMVVYITAALPDLLSCPASPAPFFPSLLLEV